MAKKQEVSPEKNSFAALHAVIAQVKKAQAIYSKFSQEQVDEIIYRAAIAANKARVLLAKEAVKETGMGIVEDKVIKNHFAAEFVYNKYRNTKTCGLVEHDEVHGLDRFSESMGIIAAITPCTNPTSTVIFKSLLALKTRNGIIFSPHNRSINSANLTIKIIQDAAVKAGAPEGLLACVPEVSREVTQELMSHKDIAFILATGGPSLVRAAYSSGTPAIGVGAGNPPALIDESANIPMAVSSILLSKAFDNGVICASEQSIIVVDSVYEKVKNEFIKQSAYFLSPEEREKVGEILLIDRQMNPKVVGQSVLNIAKLAGIDVPKTAKVLIGEVEIVGKDEPFSYEKLSPVLACYRVKDYKEGTKRAAELVEFGGLGHTSIFYTNEAINKDRIDYFREHLKTTRVLINIPGSVGSIGDVYNFRLEPSLTLGCGTYGGNSISENIGVKHLLNTKMVIERRDNMLWFRVPPEIYFKHGSLLTFLSGLENIKKVFIVCGQTFFRGGYNEKIGDIFNEKGIQFEIFKDIKPDPDLATVKKGLTQLNLFKPDMILAFGGGSPMDAAKVMWLMYERPDVEFEELTMRFMDIRKRVYKISKHNFKAEFVAVPTTSGTGSEVTPFAVITDEKEKIKYPIADYSITPTVAIIDPALVLDMPKSLTAIGGYDAVTHAIEAIVSVVATDYSNALAYKAIKMLFKYLPIAYEEGEKNPVAREKVHYASTMAGMAFANAFLGLCHSMAHKLGSSFHVTHGVANAILLPYIIRFNATDAPRKMVPFPQYKTPEAIKRYAKIADELGLQGKTPEAKVEALIKALEKLRADLNIPSTIKETGVNKADFMAQLDELAEQAFDDQCTGSNPRYPLIEEIKQLFIQAFE